MEKNVLNNSDHRFLMADFLISALIIPFYSGATARNTIRGPSNNFALTTNWKPYDESERAKFKKLAISRFSQWGQQGGNNIDSMGQIIFDSSRAVTFECSGMIRRKLVMEDNSQVKMAMLALQTAMVCDPMAANRIFVHGLRRAKRIRMKGRTKRSVLDISKAEQKRVQYMQ